MQAEKNAITVTHKASNMPVLLKVKNTFKLLIMCSLFILTFTSCEKDNVSYTTWYSYDGPYYLKLHFKDRTIVNLETKDYHNIDFYSGVPILGTYTQYENVVSMKLYIDGKTSEVKGTITGKSMEVVFLQDNFVLLFIRE